MDFTNIKTFNDLLDAKYGKPESPERKEFEEKALINYQKELKLEERALFEENKKINDWTKSFNQKITTMTDKSREINI